MLTACVQAAIPSYKITWTTPSVDSLDSMPLSGRFGAGANVWVQDGSIWLYLAHNGAYDENGRLLKLGCVRLTPKELGLGGEGFVQELDPSTGAITIRQGDFKATLWFAGETLVYESSSEKAAPLEVAFGTWREKTKDGIRNDMMGSKTTFTGDQITASTSGFFWFHRNDDHPVDLAGLAKGQGSLPESLPEKTTAGRVFGAAVCVDGGMTKPTESEVRWQFWNGKAWTGTTEARKDHLVIMRLEGEVGADPKKWPGEAKSLLVQKSREAAKADELKRWDEFWSRSHVVINPEAGEADPGFLIGRNYQLFRYMQAANRDGELPQLFNGGIFTTDNNGRIKGNNNDELPTFEGEPITPDFVLKLGWAAGRVLGRQARDSRARNLVIIGKDTRISGASDVSRTGSSWMAGLLVVSIYSPPRSFSLGAGAGAGAVASVRALTTLASRSSITSPLGRSAS
jgi:hypothetical protein